MADLSGRPIRSTDWTTLLAIFGTGIVLAVAILPDLGEVHRKRFAPVAAGLRY